MSNTRIKDLTTTALTAASDDYLAIDGATNGTRKIKPSDIGGSSITVDSSMSSTSENPVQNKVIYAQLIQANNVLQQLASTIPNDDHINSLIDTKLGVIENGTY